MHGASRRLESEGAIEGYAAVLNPARVGLAVLAIVQVKLTEHTDETVARFEREIERMDEVTKCLAMTGSYDFILEVYGKDLEALSNVVLKKLIRVPNVRDMQSSVVLADDQAHGANSAGAPADLEHMRNEQAVVCRESRVASRQSVCYTLNHMVQCYRSSFDASFAALSDATRRGVLQQLGRADASTPWSSSVDTSM